MLKIIKNRYTLEWVDFVYLKPKKFVLESCKTYYFDRIFMGYIWDLSWDTAQKMKFPLRISSVNVTKSTGNCGFGHIYWRNPQSKTLFFVQRDSWEPSLSSIKKFREKYSLFKKKQTIVFENSPLTSIFAFVESSS